MQISDCARPVLSALALGAALCLTPALAVAKGSTVGGNLLSGALATAGPALSANSFYTLDVSKIDSNDAFGAAINEIRDLQIGGLSRVVGIGWDVRLFADTPSWLSEMTVSFGPTSGPAIFLNPAAGDDFSGRQDYSSGGVVDLIGLGFDFDVAADGNLRMEFFESFDDYAGDFDGIWRSGTLTIEVTPVPEPATYGLMALGLFAVGAAARRRRG